MMTEESIRNLKKLRSFNNGSYAPTIILDKWCIDALIKYSEEQHKKELGDFGNFLKAVKEADNDKTN